MSAGKILNSQADLATFATLLKQDVLLSTNCHALGTIQSFNSDDQKVNVSINYKRTVNGKLLDYPALVDCPVLIAQGGGSYLTFPIAIGDTCLVCFNDRDMDKWISSGQIGKVNTARTHAFSDAIALVGIRAFSNAFDDYDTTNVVLHGAGAAKLGLSNDTTDLKTCLNALIDALSALTTAMSSATPATVVAAIATPSATATTAIGLAKTALAGLLK